MVQQIVQRNHVQVLGDGPKTMIFAHGFGCDQNMWRHVYPAFMDEYRVVLFDHVGSGQSDLKQYDRRKYGSLHGYADDVLEILDALEVKEAVFVGHSVSAMIGVLAAIRKPQRFSDLILVGPSPCYINDGDYVGGFSRQDIEGLLESMDSNYLGWSASMAPVIMGNADRPALGEELNNSFCRNDPQIARHFARVTFLSDNRSDLPRLEVPSLILQCSNDVIAPLQVGEYLHRTLKKSHLEVMKATGHCPNLSAPEETRDLMRKYLSAR